MTIIAISWTRGNKKALATILPIKYWEKVRALPRFDYTDIASVNPVKQICCSFILIITSNHVLFLRTFPL